MESSPMLLSVVIPTHNEPKNLTLTVTRLTDVLCRAEIPYEIVIVNDNSTDTTGEIAAELASADPQIRVVTRTKLGGFGRAVRAGLAIIRGDAVAIVMSDQSDDPEDLVRYYRKLEEGYDCVFGSRFRKGSKVVNYPPQKLVINRAVNRLIQCFFWCPFNDLTNAFKIYRREVIEDCGPYAASHFNLTIEMSLSALIRRYRIAEIPIRWYGRHWGMSNLSMWSMGRRYLSTVLKIFFERWLIADDIFEERLLRRAEFLDRVERTWGALEAAERDPGQAESEKGPTVPHVIRSG